MFKVTPAAADQIRQAARQSGLEELLLRLAAAKKPDGAIEYKMGFDEPTEDDIRFSSEGIGIVIAPESVPLLDRTVLDFVQLEEGDQQFIFLNPDDPNYTPPED